MKTKLIWTSLALLPLAVWLGAQVQNATAARKPLSEMAPGNALVWIEAKDLKGLVTAWDASPEKKTWLGSDTYQSYIRSKLALRLEEVQKAYADGIGVNPGFELLENVAGGESAVAVYDIGKLEVLYLTRLPAASIAQTLLMQGRAKFQARSAGGQTYYVKSTSDGTVAFAAVGDLLIAGSREDLVAGVLSQRPGLRQERWFADALSKASNNPDVRMLVNMERAVKTPHFRSYWIQQNVTELSQYYAAICDLQMGAAAWTEQRTLLRREAGPAVDDSGLAKLAIFVPVDAGFYQAWAKPSSAQVAALLSERIVPRGGTGATNPEASLAPGVAVESNAGSEEQLEDRVDAVEVTESAQTAPLPIVKLAGTPVEAAAQVKSSRASTVLVGIDSAAVFLASTNWDENAVKSAVQASAERAWSAGTLTWNRRGNSAIWELSGLNPTFVSVRGTLLVVGNSAELVDKILAGSGRTTMQGIYVSGYRHGAERQNYARMMGHIDAPQIPATEGGNKRAPMLFSETLGDLGKILQRVDSSSVEVRDDGAVVKQTVVYRKQP